MYQMFLHNQLALTIIATIIRMSLVVARLPMVAGPWANRLIDACWSHSPLSTRGLNVWPAFTGCRYHRLKENSVISWPENQLFKNRDWPQKNERGWIIIGWGFVRCRLYCKKRGWIIWWGELEKEGL